MRPPHAFVGGTDAAAPPLILLHGSDGNETDLLPLAGDLMPGATRMGLRGTVVMDGGYGFFRRFADRRIDEDDLRSRLPALAAQIHQTCAAHHLAQRPLAVGFSNGAIMAAALAMTHPDLLRAAVLLRPLMPFVDHTGSGLAGLPVLILDGLHDERRSPGDGRHLAHQLRRSGAQVTHHELPTGHAITAEDGRIARRWLEALSASGPANIP
ncbi:alpha/beta hydrolase [Ornithinimicrobium sp. LYQ92]|uniref:alpha/beta hydrolase n=1 Tax=Serinicoccus sp. LYQ92 TaxID=3378798 RepID=UPI0038531259